MLAIATSKILLIVGFSRISSIDRTVLLYVCVSDSKSEKLREKHCCGNA